MAMLGQCRKRKWEAQPSAQSQSAMLKPLRSLQFGFYAKPDFRSTISTETTVVRTQYQASAAVVEISQSPQARPSHAQNTAYGGILLRPTRARTKPVRFF